MRRCLRCIRPVTQSNCALVSDELLVINWNQWRVLYSPQNTARLTSWDTPPAASFAGAAVPGCPTPPGPPPSTGPPPGHTTEPSLLQWLSRSFLLTWSQIFHYSPLLFLIRSLACILVLQRSDLTAEGSTGAERKVSWDNLREAFGALCDVIKGLSQEDTFWKGEQA